MKRKLFLIISFAVSLLFTALTSDMTKIAAWGVLLYSFKNSEQEAKWYSPYFLFMATIISYILYLPVLGGVFMDDLLLETRIFVVLSLFAVCIGFSCMRNMGKKPLDIGVISENYSLVFLLGLLPTAISYYMFGNITQLEGSEMIEAKENFSLPIIGQLAYFLPASIVVAAKKDNTKLIILSVFFSFLAALLTISKTAILITFIFIVIAISKYNPSITLNPIYKKINSLKFIIIPVLLIALFIYNNNIRQEATSDREMAYVEYSESTVFSQFGTGNFTQNMFLNYCYFVQPWSNLNYNIENNRREGSFGGNTLAQFGKKLGIKTHPISKIQPYFLNTHTFLTDYYLDFGFFFGVVMAYILGMFIYYCYARFGLSDDPLLISFDILVSYATVMMFFSNHFNNGYLLNYFITFGLVSFFTRLTNR